MVLSYEEQRLQNIKDNQALLLSLGLSDPTKQKVKTSSKAANGKPTGPRKSVNTKRKSDHGFFKPDPEDEKADEDEEEQGVQVKKPRKQKMEVVDDDDAPNLRRSRRMSGRKVDYTDMGLEKSSLEASAKRIAQIEKWEDGRSESGEDGEGRVRFRKAKRMGMRTQDPKKFGHIQGVEVGRWWATRMDASTDAVHAPTVAGISGNSCDGAWSVALSGGYPDDVDLGDAFTYTGSGGRDLKGTKQNPKNLRTAPQTSDQTFDNPKNAALKMSAETHKPVRVIRGYKLDSPYAPREGYRYDGLYTVERAWMAKGLTKGLLVCRYAFKRVDGQPPLIVRDDEEGGEDADENVDEGDEDEE